MLARLAGAAECGPPPADVLDCDEDLRFAAGPLHRIDLQSYPPTATGRAALLLGPGQKTASTSRRNRRTDTQRDEGPLRSR